MTHARSRPRASTKRTSSHHPGTQVSSKNGVSAMHETSTETGGAIKGLKTWIAVSVALIALVAVLGSGASPASAALVRPSKGQLTKADGTTIFPFSSPTGLATDPSGNIWVTDPGAGVVDKFDPAGRFAAANNGAGSFTGSPYIESVAFSAAAEKVLVSDSNADDIWGLKPDATYAGIDLKESPGAEWGHGCCFIRVAADNSTTATGGVLYVFSSNGKIFRVDAAGVPVDPFIAGPNPGISELTGAQTPAKSFAPFGERKGGGIAVDPVSGNLYVADGAHHVLDIFSTSGELLETVETGEAGKPLGEISAVTVDPTNGNLLVADPTNRVIDEFAPSGAFIAAISEANGAAFGTLQGVAVDPSGRLYVADGSNHVVDVFGSKVIVPDVTTGLVSNLGDSQTSLTLNGTVNTTGAAPTTALTDCHFRYVSDAAFKASGFVDLSSGGEAPCVPAAASIPNDGANHPVSADISGLTPGVVYRYQLVASNSNGANRGAVRAAPRLVLADVIANVAATSADLGAEIDPSGVLTKYHVEYLTEAEYEANGNLFSGPNLPTSLPDGSIPAGESPVGVLQHVQGLTPATVYRFRVAIANAFGAVHTFGRTFTTQASGSTGPFALLDGRQWEQVSPPEKRGSLLGGGSQASAAGDAIAYFSRSATEAEPEGASFDIKVLSARNSAGWASHDVTLPHRSASGQTTEIPFFSADLSLSVIAPFGPSVNPLLSPEVSEQTPYLRTNFPPGNPTQFCAASCYRPLLTAAPGVANIPHGTVLVPCDQAGREEERCASPQFVDASPDGSHIILTTVSFGGGFSGGIYHVALTSTPGDEGGLYEWFDGSLTLVSVLPGNAGPALPATDPVLGSEFLGGGNVSTSVSADGSRIIWGEGTGDGNPHPHHLYLRDLAAAETVQLDAVQGGTGAGQATAKFQVASADGSVVYFSDEQQLTPDSGAAINSPDLYRCKVVKEAGKLTCQLTDLTPQSSGEPGGAVGSVLGSSEDGSSVYFVANGVLAANQVSNGAGPEQAHPGNCHPMGGGAEPGTTCSLYRRQDGTTTFIATLSGEDEPATNQQPRERPARVSPNGQWLAFMSQRRLTGYDNTDAVTGLPDQEVFLYRAGGDELEPKLICASCNPTGARPHGVKFVGNSVNEPPEIEGGLENFQGRQGIAATLPGWSYSGRYQSRALSNSGRLFFDGADALLPNDSNGLADVYEYEPVGIGDCIGSRPAFTPASGGCLGLISSGTSKQESVFLDASESGNDVFFTTTSQLAATDTDSAPDVYDAHLCSAAVPCLAPPPPPQPACEGDACQHPVAPPSDATPGSLTFNGPGDVSPPLPVITKKTVKCRKNLVKNKQGACIKKRSRSKKRVKPKTHKAKKSAHTNRRTGR